MIVMFLLFLILVERFTIIHLENNDMANFDIAQGITLHQSIEGGYSDSKSDKGNYNSKGVLVGTNFGISAPTFELFYGFVPTKNDMMELTKDRAILIMYQLFWVKKANGEKINHQGVANAIFDCCVNHGKGVYLVQDVLGVKKDGIIGPVTLKAINDADPKEFFDKLQARREAYYREIVANDKSQKPNLVGWLARLDRLEQLNKVYMNYSPEDNPTPPKKKSKFLGLAATAAIAYLIFN